MDINDDMMNKVKRMDDAQFRQLASEIATAAGADPQKTAAFLRDISSIRGILNDMTPQEAQNLLNKVGQDRAEGILKDIKDRF